MGWDGRHFVTSAASQSSVFLVVVELMPLEPCIVGSVGKWSDGPPGSTRQ